MATPWPRGKLTNFTRERWQNKRRRRGKIRFYEREELPWTFIGFVKAVGIRLPNFFTCSRVKGKREKKERRKKKIYFTKESLVEIDGVDYWIAVLF